MFAHKNPMGQKFNKKRAYDSMQLVALFVQIVIKMPFIVLDWHDSNKQLWRL